MTLLNQGDGNTKLRDFFNEGLCPIDRVDHPNPVFPQSPGIIRGFFREPSVVRKCGEELCMKKIVDREVC